ncbi:unnamed protein product, partial [Allacma fusca]
MQRSFPGNSCLTLRIQTAGKGTLIL